MVVEMVVEPDGTLQDSGVYRARVTNHAKLAYRSVAAWLDGNASPPEALAAVKGLNETLRLQDSTAQRMKAYRHIHGALSLETIEAKAQFDGDRIRALDLEEGNRAKEIVENLMIAANGVTARYLSAKKFPSIRHVVRAPKRWDRIVALAAERNFALPSLPDPKALEGFLVKEKAADPVGFPDLSLAVIKLLGAGEYVAELPEGNAQGHFGLAVKDYAHSTAPNRRYPDLLTQRLLKAAVDGEPVPYHKDELDVLTAHCTEGEDAANKVERQVAKSAAVPEPRRLPMNKRAGLWIDHRKAVIVMIAEDGEETTEITSDMEQHVRFSGKTDSEDGSRENVRDRQFEKRLNLYYDRVVEVVRGADIIQIFGPGEAKGVLRKRLGHHGLQSRVLAIEAADKMTDRQIAAKVRESPPD